MNHLKILHDYLTNRSQHPVEGGGLPFVTISRQAGAGGHLLAYVIMTDFLKYAAANDLFGGWHVFDKEITEILAQDPILRDSMATIRDAHFKSEARNFLESLFAGRDAPYLATKKSFEIVYLLAAIGKTIIVGRGACCVARRLPLGIHIRLVAPEATRIKWIVRRFKISEDDARTAMLREDRDRQRMFTTFFNRDIDDPLLYDAVWNTASVDLHEISESVITMLRRRKETHKGDVIDPSNRDLADFFRFKKE